MRRSEPYPRTHSQRAWWPFWLLGNSRASSTLPSGSTAAAASDALWESTPIATSILASSPRPTYDGGWRRTSRLGLPAFYQVTSAGPVPAGGTVRSKVSGTTVGRDLRFRSHLRPVPGTLSRRRTPPGDFIRLRFAAEHVPGAGRPQNPHTW